MRLWPRRRQSTRARPRANLQRNLTFAATLDEARARFARYGGIDPFPEIPPALLNSADIADYVAETGMIFPFYPDGLKAASYEVRLLGEAVYWEEGELWSQEIRPDEEFELPRNAIAFVTLEPEFQLPAYIALRFNLKIPNVYKGLLLGTGPLVDPGWEGRLSIPLHNLTTNKYTFRGGDPLIWMEFTKLSPYHTWTALKRDARRRRGVYVEFPEEKKGGTVRTRLEAAAPNMPVSSSLASALSQADRAAETARSLSRRITFGGAIATVFGLATIVALAVDVLFLDRDRGGSDRPAVIVRQAPTVEPRLRALERRIAAVERRQRAGPR